MKINREIKFRGKPTSNIVNWLYGDLIQKSDGTKQILSIGNYPLKGMWVIPETVGQFTGLKDKNGKEIYEYDIVKWIDSDSNIRKDIVRFSHGVFHLCNNSYSIGSYIHNNLEVIGNIYDNKNLLENGKSGTEN